MTARVLGFHERFVIDAAGVARLRPGVVEAEAREAALQSIPARYAEYSRESWRGAWPLSADFDLWPLSAPEGPRAPWCVLFIGTVGTGKTHAATALFREGLKRTAGGFWLDVADALETIRGAIGSGSRSPIEAALVTRGVLLLDDLGAERPTDFSREIVERTLRHRHAHRLPTIATSNATSSADLERVLDWRVVSRLSEGKFQPLVGRDRRLGA